MTTELYWMLLTVLMTSVFWMLYIVDRLLVRDLLPTLQANTPETGAPHSAWAQRAMRAHANGIENLVLFAAVVLALHVLKISTPLTEAAAATYFFARLVHFAVYTAGIPFLRPLAFGVAWIALLIMVFAALGWL